MAFSWLINGGHPNNLHPTGIILQASTLGFGILSHYVMYMILYIPDACLGFLPSTVSIPASKRTTTTVLLFDAKRPEA